jgi:hypothetical protein
MDFPFLVGFTTHNAGKNTRQLSLHRRYVTVHETGYDTVHERNHALPRRAAECWSVT